MSELKNWIIINWIAYFISHYTNAGRTYNSGQRVLCRFPITRWLTKKTHFFFWMFNFAPRGPLLVISYYLRIQRSLSINSISSNFLQVFWTRSFSYTLPLYRKNMPPKKVVKEERILLGRPSNNLKIGVVGLPNVG